MSDTYFIPERTTAHRKAVELFSEDFFWDITDDNSPFGNDDGADTLANLHRYFQEGETDLFIAMRRSCQLLQPTGWSPKNELND